MTIIAFITAAYLVIAVYFADIYAASAVIRISPMRWLPGLIASFFMMQSQLVDADLRRLR
jgi:hypothetical protein